jgi:hypothetical protein
MASSKMKKKYTLATCSRSKNQAEAKEDRAINIRIVALMKLPSSYRANRGAGQQ